MLTCSEGGGYVSSVAAERKKYGAEDDDNADFDERGPVLEIGAFAGAPDVDGGDYGDHDDGEHSLSDGGEWDNFREMFRKGAGQGGDGAAGNHQKQTPAVEERGDASEAVANEAVEPPGFRVCRGQFGVGEGAEEREHTADNPDQQREADRAVELAKNQAGRQEDAGADDRADEE